MNTTLMRRVLVVALIAVASPCPARAQESRAGIGSGWAGMSDGHGFVDAQPSAAVPRSALPIILIGVALNTAAPSKSACLVRCASPGEEPGTFTFQRGENACGVAEITAVLQNAAVVRNLLTNRLELLTFGGSSAPRTAAVPPASSPVPVPLVVTQSPARVNVTLQRASVDHYARNLSDVLGAALATPHFHDTDGQRMIDGFELEQIKTGSIVEQLGLKNGDVIAEVNGDKLDSLAAAVRLVGQALPMPQASMTVLRNGQRITFVVNTQ
jgi:hypothetical protein